MWLMRERDFSWGAMPFTGCFETTDGAIVIVGAFKANPLQEICIALGLPDLSADPRFNSYETASTHRNALHAMLRGACRSGNLATARSPRPGLGGTSSTPSRRCGLSLNLR